MGVGGSCGRRVSSSPTRRLPPMHPAVQISQSLCQSGFIRLPGHSIHPCGRFPFQPVEALAQECLRQMMEQRSELLFLPLPSCLSHACQNLGHALPVLCRTRVGRAGVLLDPRSSLPALRVQRAPNCSRDSSVLHLGPTPPVRACGRYGIPAFPAGLSPFPAQAPRNYSFAAQSPGPPMTLSTLRWLPRGRPRKTLGQDGVATSFPVRLFPSLLHAGLGRRTTKPTSRMGSSRVQDDRPHMQLCTIFDLLGRQRLAA